MVKVRKGANGSIKIKESFIDLGHTFGESKPVSMDKEKHYPSFHVSKKIAGLDEVGKTKTVKMKVRVASANKRLGHDPSYDIELLGIGE